MRVHHYHAGHVQSELAFARPRAPLAAIVHEHVGWIDPSSVPICLRELPSGNIPLIIYVHGSVGGYDAFAAGLHDAATIVRSHGPASGVQANLTALGARLLFNRPLKDFTNRPQERGSHNTQHDSARTRLVSSLIVRSGQNRREAFAARPCQISRDRVIRRHYCE